MNNETKLNPIEIAVIKKLKSFGGECNRHYFLMSFVGNHSKISEKIKEEESSKLNINVETATQALETLGEKGILSLTMDLKIILKK
ncbi:hypothetical protein A2331_04840 [Candidatus Falkowbacteria bacterium RIFOXYB2_FULL_34_18]|uniref:Uncharacterized protein n=1 Tax=Candidatus Falkowbacteria bacterium RIFOXYD2_FULL_34_120 TaxID=1798007 RepID=A0A1F5TNX4_9BACT|nr:MAG: hypothetical protein A2331_04840 [Candidatus Falkowbacteria bacterium RIFOXYB2_FULL_34_18]OGF28853.1 MAG: hypothetical protein A2500_00535 [Candidatus Falkowbacteria bacterium RIFOXYC12_FULL_34_55]OGF35774.1 MAG: hypothetical protein A2466_04535 [Candidatus Falkowbacteria bacterium RIFOXYC2_FULL_34_220]OGF38440.1 MAG: hypothetical protein A2515_01975 [Candidatus Falkowbacteria bacterium RIFOXYD12_FULL_34_57]OGF40504.1 MAG: hypothetical protein A2531_02950 [Candidatus Falkowbacteria bact